MCDITELGMCSSLSFFFCLACANLSRLSCRLGPAPTSWVGEAGRCLSPRRGLEGGPKPGGL